MSGDPNEPAEELAKTLCEHAISIEPRVRLILIVIHPSHPEAYTLGGCNFTRHEALQIMREEVSNLELDLEEGRPTFEYTKGEKS